MDDRFEQGLHSAMLCAARMKKYVLQGRIYIIGFDRETLKNKELMMAIEMIKSKKNIIGADVLGFVLYADCEVGHMWNNCADKFEHESMQLYKSIIGAFLRLISMMQ